MKQTLTILFFIAISGSVLSQGHTLSSYLERTPITPKAGLSTGMSTITGWELGIFIQRTIYKPNEHESLIPSYFEKEYFGFYTQHQIYEYKEVRLKLHVKAGMMNRQKFLLAPSLRYGFDITKNTGVDLGLGGAALGTGTFRPTMIVAFQFRSF